MLTIKKYIISFGVFLLMCFVFYALSPCVVKSYVLDFVETDYYKPLNPNKSTTSNGNCHSGQVLKITNNQIDKFSNEKELIRENQNHHQKLIYLPIYQINNSYDSSPLVKIPPKYILFKCLKIKLEN